MDSESERLIVGHMRCARAIAYATWKRAPATLDIDELTSAAYYGLVSAVARWPEYCKERGFDDRKQDYFKAYVNRRIQGAVLDSLRSADYTNRTVRLRQRKLQDAGLDRGASVAEMSRDSGLDEKAVLKTLAEIEARPYSINSTMPTEYGDVEFDVAGPTNVVSDAVVDLVLAKLVETIRGMDFEKQVILSLHYYQGHQLCEIAKMIEITESMASKLHVEAVVEVREAMMEAMDCGD